MLAIIVRLCAAVLLIVTMVFLGFAWNGQAGVSWESLNRYSDSQSDTHRLARSHLRACEEKYGHLPYDKWPVKAKEWHQNILRILNEQP